MIRVLIAVAVLAGVAGAAPTRVVHGVVTVEHGTRPISGATVVTEHGDLAVTDVDGYFAISVALAERELTVAATGYAARTVQIEDSLHVELTAASGGEVIEVTGTAPEQTKAISYRLTPDEIQLLPGAANDALRAAQALPGVARIPYGFGGLVLRGTSPRDTLVYLDGIEVPLAFHFGGITSFYPGSMLGDLTLTSGGFEAAYGRAEGGIVTLTTREPRRDRWHVGGSVGLLDSGVSAEGPLGSGGIVIGVRRSYFDTIAQPFVAGNVPLPSYWDAQVRTSFGDPRHLGRISPMVFLSIDSIANNADGTSTEKIAITSSFVRVAAPYLLQRGPWTLHVVPWLGANQLTFESTTNGQAESFHRPLYPGGLRAELTRDTAWGHLRGGFDGEGGYLSHSQLGFTGAGTGPMQQDGTSTVGWIDAALWAEARVALDGERFAVKPGLRVDAYGLTGELVVDPRLNISQRLDDTFTLRQAVGRYHQPPTPADVDRADGNPRIKSSYYDQASLGLEGNRAGYSASITGFFDTGQGLGVQASRRPGDDFVQSLGGLGPTFELLLEKQLGFALYRQNFGRARSYGAELLVKRNVGRWFGMVAYTLSQAQRIDDSQTVAAWRPFELDQLHNLNLAGSVKLADWRLGMRLQLVSGNPYSPSVVLPSGDVVQQPWAATLPVFFSLDVRVDRRWPRCWGDINFFIDIQNATNQANVEGRQYDASLGRDVDIPGLPVVPFIGVEFMPK